MFRFDRLIFRGVVYLRYIDDIKLMAKDESTVRRALLRLDIASKYVGLVPQAQKIECRKVANLDELRKTVPSSVLALTQRGRASPASQKRLTKMFHASITKKQGIWLVTDSTKFKFSLFRMNAARPILRRIAQIMPHRPDLSWLFSIYLKKFPNDNEAADVPVSCFASRPYV